MSGWSSANIHDIERRDGTWIPIRDHFGIDAFGLNAYTADAGGTVIANHDEVDTQHEELYVVVAGHARFTIAGDEVDAPFGTIVFVRDPAATRSAVAKEDGTVILIAGGARGTAFEVSAWERSWRWTSEGMALYREGRYAEAADVFRRGLAAVPEHSGLRYNVACTLALAGDREAALAELAAAVDAQPSFAGLAQTDSDFDSIRDDPRFPRAAS